MPPEASLQHKLDRVRRPRVQITYDVETNGSPIKKELPFVLGVMADLSGHPGPAVNEDGCDLQLMSAVTDVSGLPTSGKRAMRTLESGVTTVRDLGLDQYMDIAMRDLINHGEM